MKLIATKRKDLDTCPIDYFSIGHIIFGHIAYLISYFIIILWLKTPHPREYALITTILIGVVWELIENVWLANTRLKFEKRKDSVENSQCDVLFVFLGGLICQIFSLFDSSLFIFLSIVFIAVGFLLFEQCCTMTINNEE